MFVVCVCVCTLHYFSTNLFQFLCQAFESESHSFQFLVKNDDVTWFEEPKHADNEPLVSDDLDMYLFTRKQQRAVI